MAVDMAVQTKERLKFDIFLSVAPTPTQTPKPKDADQDVPKPKNVMDSLMKDISTMNIAFTFWIQRLGSQRRLVGTPVYPHASVELFLLDKQAQGHRGQFIQCRSRVRSQDHSRHRVLSRSILRPDPISLYFRDHARGASG